MAGEDCTIRPLGTNAKRAQTAQHPDLAHLESFRSGAEIILQVLCDAGFARTVGEDFHNGRLTEVTMFAAQ